MTHLALCISSGNIDEVFLSVKRHGVKLGENAILGQGSTDQADEKMDLVDAVGADGSRCGKLYWVCEAATPTCC